MPDARRKILDASIDLVAERGVRAVSFREAARRAGVSHQTPYHHFGDHHGILAEIAREGFVGLADAMTEAARAEAVPLASLREAGRAYVAFATCHVGHFRVMFQHPLDAETDAEAVEQGERAFAVLQALARDAVDAGYGRGLPSDRLADLCWSVTHGVASLRVEGILHAGAPRSPADRSDGVVEALSALLQDGVDALT